MAERTHIRIAGERRDIPSVRFLPAVLRKSFRRKRRRQQIVPTQRLSNCGVPFHALLAVLGSTNPMVVFVTVSTREESHLNVPTDRNEADTLECRQHPSPNERH